MTNYTLEELRNNLDRILSEAAYDDEFATVQIDKNQKVVIVSEGEWKMLCESFAMLIGAKLRLEKE